MIGAIVWFILGLVNDRIFFYPPILFIVGFIAFVKGLMTTTTMMTARAASAAWSMTTTSRRLFRFGRSSS